MRATFCCSQLEDRGGTFIQNFVWMSRLIMTHTFKEGTNMFITHIMEAFWGGQSSSQAGPTQLEEKGKKTGLGFE